MTINTYVQGYPPDGYSLGQTKTQIRNNLDGTFLTLAQDHFNNNASAPGKHQFVRLPSAVTPSPSTTGSTELFLINGTTTVGGANNLFFIPPSTAVSSCVQFTRNEIPVNSSSGFSWLPGGLLFQWGSVTISSPLISVDVTFPTPFKSGTSPYSVSLTNNSINPTATLAAALKTGAQSNQKFTIITNITNVSVFWTAIGT